MDGTESVRAYYRAIDGDDYAALEGLLVDGFVHERPDRTIEGRPAFVAFMRSGRPDGDTEHVVETIYAAEDPDGRLAAEGRLLGADGTEYFGFVDTFEVADGRIQRLRTYTDVHDG